MLKNELRESQIQFWDHASKSKNFEDPFYLDKFASYTDKQSFIIEYGCGYGRILNILKKNHYSNLTGFDFSPLMIERGRREFPDINIQLINHGKLPLENNSIDAAIISTVLCCTPDFKAQNQIISEIERVLKPGGIIYVCDFLLNDNPDMTQKYQNSFELFQDWGVYRTTEDAIVRHHSKEHLKNLFQKFFPLWYHEEDFYTMNRNLAKTFHCIYKKQNITQI